MLTTVTETSFRPDRLDRFWWFICERQTIWYRRSVLHQPGPWTDNPIMREQRFTNIYRELDPGTQYVISHILEVEAHKPDKIFNTMLYRLIGRAETHAAIGFQPLATFDPAQLERSLKHLRDVDGMKVFTAAYMVSAYHSMGSHDKIENICRLFALLHQDFDRFYRRIQQSTSPEQVYGVLATAHGFGNFLAYQVLVDLLYPLRIYEGKPLLPYSHDQWASAGPGAQRGIKMLLRPGASYENLDVMRWLRIHQRSEFQRLGLDFPYRTDERGEPVEISLANIQNCLCEFHKFIKIGDGTGRGRRRFAGVAAGSTTRKSTRTTTRNAARKATSKTTPGTTTQLPLSFDGI